MKPVKVFLLLSFLTMFGALAFNPREWGGLFLYWTAVFIIFAVFCVVTQKEEEFISEDEYIQVEGVNMYGKS